MAGIARIVGAEKIEEALLNAFEQWTRDDVNGRYWRERFEERYPYPGPVTIRKAKPPAGNPRDILDTEALYKSGIESYNYDENNQGAKAEWHWDAKNSNGQEYAWYVHEGEGPASRAPRRWTDELSSDYLFEASDIKLDLMDGIANELGRIKI